MKKFLFPLVFFVFCGCAAGPEVFLHSIATCGKNPQEKEEPQWTVLTEKK